MGSVVQQMFPSEGVSQPMAQNMFSMDMDIAHHVNPHSGDIHFNTLEMGILFPLAYQMHKVCAPIDCVHEDATPMR